jgi:hypothetical protein
VAISISPTVDPDQRPAGASFYFERSFHVEASMNTYDGLSALLIVSSLAIASPAWSADSTDRPAQPPATTAPAPTNNPMMMGGPAGMGQSNAAPSSTMMTNCKQHMEGMQKSLGDMMGNIDDMMKNAKTRDMRKHLQAMHDQMSAMMVKMQQMQGMMGGGMMQGGQAPTTTPPATPAPPTTAPADHNTHHPN